jgi:hypothetical protein
MADEDDPLICGTEACAAPASARTQPAVLSSAAELSVISDAICPWCYVGKRRLEQALALIDGARPFKVTWRPFQLNPHMPKEGVDRREYRMRKFGSWERSQALDAQLREVGQSVGIDFRHDLMKRTPNTFDAHRVIWLAGREDRRTPWWSGCSAPISARGATSEITASLRDWRRKRGSTPQRSWRAARAPRK